MKLSLDGLLIIDAISRRGSFASAAEEPSRVPSTITYAVQKLEENSGVQIFDRSRPRARLTEAGRELLREGRGKPLPGQASGKNPTTPSPYWGEKPIGAARRARRTSVWRCAIRGDAARARALHEHASGQRATP